MQSLTQTDVWQALVKHRRSIENVHLRDLFAKNPKRSAEFSLRLDNLLLDYSKNRIDGETLKLLLRLARETQVEQLRDQMFAGEAINLTEHRRRYIAPCEIAVIAQF